MKIYSDVLNPEFADKLYLYGKNKVSGNSMGYPPTHAWLNLYTWQEAIVKDSTAVFCTQLPKVLSNELKDNLILFNNKYIFDYQTDVVDKEFMIFVWTQGAYIPAHRDDKYKKGMTIYLNRDWAEEDGGQFNWQDLETNELHTYTPVFNSAAINDDHTLHFTHPVKAVNKPRITVQAFFEEALPDESTFVSMIDA